MVETQKAGDVTIMITREVKGDQLNTVSIRHMVKSQRLWYVICSTLVLRVDSMLYIYMLI